MSYDSYVEDLMGNRIYGGDYVECRIAHYASIRRGERRRVQRIENGRIVLNNNGSPHGTSPYRVCHFKLAERHHAWHKTQEATMAKNTLYVAVRINDMSYQQVAHALNSNMQMEAEARTSYEELQAFLRMRIQCNPIERWLVLTGTTLAEISAPPVSFRPA